MFALLPTRKKEIALAIYVTFSLSLSLSLSHSLFLSFSLQAPFFGKKEPRERARKCS
jgi:hypothetical protein